MTKRKYKEGIDRQQAYLLPPKIDEYVTEDNPVQAIDVYVDSLDLEELGFKNAGGELAPGQPAFPPATLLKLYLYGYLNRMRSSRRLAAECLRNLEVIWLMEGLQPSYKTIADFRKDNLAALKRVNQDFVELCKELDLFGAELVGIDGSYFRGNVGKKSIYTTERLKLALKHIEQDIDKYLLELEQADQQEGQEIQANQTIKEKLDQLYERANKRKEQLQKLKESAGTQIVDVDEDARMLSKRGQGTVAGYNVQTAVDAKHKLLVIGEIVQDGNDGRQLAAMGKAAKAQLGVEKLTTVQDGGYFNVQKIKECLENGITPYVPEPDRFARVRKQGRFTRDDFRFDAQANCYICPAKQVLRFSTIDYKKDKKIYLYRGQSSMCGQCNFRSQCLAKKSKYRTVSRWEHEEVIEAHQVMMEKDGAEKMRQRAELCEHPFGTLKVWCGWMHFLLRGLDKVRAEFSLLMLCYNFKRVLNILGLAAFRVHCQTRGSLKPVVSN